MGHPPAVPYLGYRLFSALVVLCCTYHQAISRKTYQHQDFTITCSDVGLQRCIAEGYSPIPEQSIIGGDMIISSAVKDHDVEARNVRKDNSWRWPNATVPYVFHKSFSRGDITKMTTALHLLEKRTCVKFVPWQESGVYVLVTGDKGCTGHVGYPGEDVPFARVNLSPTGCLHRVGTIQHEFLHVLGIKHAHARPDRDTYIKVFWENILKEHKQNFEKANPNQYTTYGLPYDYKSIMHYDNLEFTSNGKPTLAAKIDPEMKLGQRVDATDIDIAMINKMYCEEETAEVYSPSVVELPTHHEVLQALLHN